MLGRGVCTASPGHHPPANAASRLTQPCQPLWGSYAQTAAQLHLIPTQVSATTNCAAIGVSPIMARHHQQQHHHHHHQGNSSTLVARAVALQQGEDFQSKMHRTNFERSNSQDHLDVVPETGLLPEVADRLDSNSAASTSTPASQVRHRSKTPKTGSQGRSKSRSYVNVNPIQTNPSAAFTPTASDSSPTVIPPNSTSSSSSSSSSTSSIASSSNNSAGSSSGVTASAAASSGASGASRASTLYPPAERSQIQESWDTLMRWSKSFRRQRQAAANPIDAAEKVVVFGGGSFGTAMGTSLALKKGDLDVVLLLRDPYLCHDINSSHINTKYLADFQLPRNVRATTDAAEAISGASYAVHAVPVQHSRSFLSSIKDVLPKDVPIICVSKGLEVGTGCMMSEVIPSALGRRQPAVFLSGPSFAKEVMQGRPTGVVAACKDINLGREIQELFASPNMRVNTTTDVTGVEICGALKNVLAIAAGIVEGLELGHNALAALIAQGCAEIRWLSQKVGAKPATISGLSGLGDIMLTCYGDLSRNRSVGVRLGKGEQLEDILASSSQVAEGVATAGVVVGLARKYRVSLPVLTAVAQVLDNNLTPAQAVTAVMNLPQIDER